MATSNQVRSRFGDDGKHAHSGREHRLALGSPASNLPQHPHAPVVAQAINSPDPSAPSARMARQSSLSTHGDRQRRAARDLIATQVILYRKIQDLTRKNLDARLAKLFTDCTGLRFHVAWFPPPPLAWDGVLPAGCAACLKRLGSTPNAKVECHNCVAKHLAVARQSGPNGHTFTCPLGTANCWVPITVQNLCLAVVCFQAAPQRVNILRRASSVKSATGRGSRRVASGIQHPVSNIQHRADLPVLGRSEFDRAARLLRLIVHDVVETDLAELEQDELASARRALAVRDKTETRLRQELRQVLPAIQTNAAGPAPGTHGQQIVHQMLDYIHENSGGSVQLKECAEKIGMNAAYLSDLFSNAVGLPFKQYVTKLRLGKARELLDDPRQTIAEVAYAVGYTNANRFRLAFKQWAGLPPFVWRADLQAKTTGHSAPA